MNTNEFIAELRKRLVGLPANELAERLEFYREVIDDRIEEGLTEEDAVRAIGTLDEVADRIREEIGTAEPMPELEPKMGKRSAREITLLILTSPLWIAFLLPALIVILAAYIVLWALVFVLWAIELPFFLLAMISKFLLVACLAATKGAIPLTKGGFLGIRKIFQRKETF